MVADPSWGLWFNYLRVISLDYGTITALRPEHVSVAVVGVTN